MTERKPAGMTIESWIERQIRVAAERGDLDGLRGAGEPIPASHGDDEMGRIRRKLVTWLRNPSPPVLPITPVDADGALARWRATAGARRFGGPAPAAPKGAHA